MFYFHFLHVQKIQIKTSHRIAKFSNSGSSWACRSQNLTGVNTHNHWPESTLAQQRYFLCLLVQTALLIRTNNPSGVCGSHSTHLSSSVTSKLPLSTDPFFVLQHKHSVRFNERSCNKSLFVQTQDGERGTAEEEGGREGGIDDKSPARTMWRWQYYILGLFLSRQG